MLKASKSLKTTSTPDSSPTKTIIEEVDVVFCAAPSTFVWTKAKANKKFFYNIFCFYIKETSQYVIFRKTFRATRKKESFGAVVETHTFSTFEEAETHLNEFLFSLCDHQRWLNEVIVNKSPLPIDRALVIINEWEDNLMKNFIFEKANKTQSLGWLENLFSSESKESI